MGNVQDAELGRRRQQLERDDLVVREVEHLHVRQFDVEHALVDAIVREVEVDGITCFAQDARQLRMLELVAQVLVGKIVHLCDASS